MAALGQMHRLRSQQVVRLHPRLLHAGQTHGARHRLDAGQLFHQRRGHLLALGLVLGQQGQPVMRAAEVEEHERGGGFLLVGQPPEGFDPAVHGVRGKAVGARELRHREEAAVGKVESVNQQPFGHGRSQTKSFVRVNRNCL